MLVEHGEIGEVALDALDELVVGLVAPDQSQLLLAAPAGAGSPRIGAHALGQPRPFRSHDDEDGGDEQSDRDPPHVFHCNAGSRVPLETPGFSTFIRMGAQTLRRGRIASDM